MTRVGAPSCFRAYSTSVFSRLEGLVWRIAPNVGNFSRVWRVMAGLALQTCATFPAFGGLWLVWRSKRGEFISRLERLVWRIAPNARNAALKQVVTHRIPTGVYTFSSRGPVAQWIERLPPEQKVVGSNPIRPTFDFLAYCACNFSRVGATTA